MTTLEPIYPFSDSADPVVLRKSSAVAKYKNSVFESEAELVLSFIPRPSIDIEGCFSPQSGTNTRDIPIFEECSSFTFDGRELDGFLRSSSVGRSGLRLKFCPRNQLLQFGSAGGAKLQRVVFHLFDFLKPTKLGSNGLVLEDEHWSVRIQQIRAYGVGDNMIRADGVTRITHLAELTRIDGEPFSSDAADRQLLMLHCFLAFVRGAWCPPICAVGFDTNREVAWERINAPRPQRPSVANWLVRHQPQQVKALYPMFSILWNRTGAWQACLREVVYWYVNANSSDSPPGIDVSILVVQAALERLSHQYAVIDRQLISAGGFKSSQFRASDKLRLLLSSLDIPIGIPAASANIAKLQKRKDWVDGPHAFTDIRNSLVHPDAKDREHLTKCIPDCWELGMWYLELALLAVCGYEDTYSNRLSRKYEWDDEQVPWREKSPP